jgi:formylglycine-generating enzyme required for sulfatase activity
MKNQSFLILLLAVSVIGTVGCGKKGNSKSVAGDGQVHGIAPAARVGMTKPVNMVFVPPGTFHMGPSDEDINYNFTARNKEVSISGFWMDKTELTNNQYRQFVYWVRDSLAAIRLGYVKTSPAGDTAVDWKKASSIKWGDKNTLEKLNDLILTPDNRLYSKMDIDPDMIVYNIQGFNLKEAARRENAGRPRKDFIYRYDQKVYPDTLCWMRDFSYSYNEPMTKRYFAHPAYGNYPVVGVNWKQAVAFCHWRTRYLNTYLEKNKKAPESDFRLPTRLSGNTLQEEVVRSQCSPGVTITCVIRRDACLRTSNPAEGIIRKTVGFIPLRPTVTGQMILDYIIWPAMFPEWTSSLFYEGSYNFQHDMNPDIQWNALDSDPPRMKRKVIRGGSWKDVGYFLQTSTAAV